jgi:hypothetical protein
LARCAEIDHVVSLAAVERSLLGARIVKMLAELRGQFGSEASFRKTELLRRASAIVLDSRGDLSLLHESLLFIRAYPDSRPVLDLAETLLRRFADRIARLSDARREAFDETGVAGSVIHVAMALPLVRALLERHPHSLSLFVEGEGVLERLVPALRELLSPAELESFADGYLLPQDWLERTGPRVPRDPLARLLQLLDARFEEERAKSTAWSLLELPISWSLGAEDGSRTLARAPSTQAHFQSGPFRRSKVQLIREISKSKPRTRHARPDEAREWIAAARHAVTARFREMDTFLYANPRDVVSADLGGVGIGVMGVLPSARHPLRAFHGYILERNGVPIGYGDFVLLFDWGEVNFHIFESFRQAESARIYASLVRFAYHHFGLRYLFLNRYQFGFKNEEAIHTGAFWFYEKLGFVPADPLLIELWRREKRAIDEDPRHRTTAADLRRLARSHMCLPLARGAEATVLRARYDGFHPMNLSLEVTRRIERRFAGDRRAASAAAITRLESFIPGARTSDVRPGLVQLAPFLDLVPDLEEFSHDERKGLAELLRAKNGSRELTYLRATQENLRLRDALVRAGMASRVPAIR